MFITREAVEGMAAQLTQGAVPSFFEHDPTHAPVGRVLEPRLIELQDGEVGLEAVFELFETSPVVIRSESEWRAAVNSLSPPEPSDGEIELVFDRTSYEIADVRAAADAARAAGSIGVDDSPVRLSMVPDPLLVVALGPIAIACGWFAKGFFTKVGETLGQAVGDDLVVAYRRFKKSIRSLVTERSLLPDQEPITMMTLLLDRPGGGQLQVEGSTREDGDDLEAFLDSGRDLAVAAMACLKLAQQPSRLARLHFRFTRDGWVFAYALDEDAERSYIAVAPDEQYEALLKEAERNSNSVDRSTSSS